MHFGMCAAIALCGAVLFALLIPSFTTSLVGGAALAIATGAGKEYGDSKSVGNHWCWWDLLADGLGAISGAAIGACSTLLIYTEL